MAEQTQMDSLLAGEPAFAPVEPEPAVEAAPETVRERPAQVAAERPAQAAVEVTATARIAIRDLEDGQRVRGVYAVRGRELRRKKNGEPWLRMTVGDATGTTEAVCWDDAEVRYALCATGSPVHVSGIFETSERWGSKIKITELRAAEEGEYELNDLAVPSEVSVERLEADPRGPPAASGGRCRPGSCASSSPASSPPTPKNGCASVTPPPRRRTTRPIATASS